jgi:hypothetical protein
MTWAVDPFIHLPSVLYAGMPGLEECVCSIHTICITEGLSRSSEHDTALFQKVIKLHLKFQGLLEVLAGNMDEDSSAMERFISQVCTFLISKHICV